MIFNSELLLTRILKPILGKIYYSVTSINSTSVKNFKLYISKKKYFHTIYEKKKWIFKKLTCQAFESKAKYDILAFWFSAAKAANLDIRYSKTFLLYIRHQNESEDFISERTWIVKSEMWNFIQLKRQFQW